MPAGITINSAATFCEWRRGTWLDKDASHPLYHQLARQYHYLRDPLLDLRDDVDFDDAIRRLVLEQTRSQRGRRFGKVV